MIRIIKLFFKFENRYGKLKIINISLLEVILFLPIIASGIVYLFELNLVFRQVLLYNYDILSLCVKLNIYK